MTSGAPRLPGDAEDLLTLLNRPLSLADPWAWCLPLDDEDLGMLPDAFVLTVRANFEEWWCTKGLDPDVARLGHRLA